MAKKAKDKVNINRDDDFEEVEAALTNAIAELDAASEKVAKALELEDTPDTASDGGQTEGAEKSATSDSADHSRKNAEPQSKSSDSEDASSGN